MADANAVSPPSADERRLAVYVLYGLLAAFALAAIADGTWIYHREQDRMQAETASAAPEPQPTDPQKAAEKAKEKEKKQSLSVWRIGEAMIRHPLFLFCIVNTLAMALLVIVFGAQYSDEAAASPGRSLPPLKLLIMGVGGLVGCTTTCFLGLGYGAYWWSELSAGGLKVWSEGWTWMLVAAVFGGLIVTFLSLLAVKSEERHNPGLRRLLYGFNAFLVGFLLLSVLAVANGLFLIYANVQAIDWTKSQQATLSAVMKKALATLDKPVEVYVFLNSEEEDYFGLANDMKTMLNNSQGYAPKLEFRILYAVSARDADKIRDLLRKYEMRFQEGMLVLFDPVAEGGHLFVKRRADGPNELGLEDEQRAMMPGEAPRSNFKGEQALLSALRELSEGKVKTTVYVTQDSGELSLTDAAQAGQREGSRSLSALRSKLEKVGYKVEPWSLGALDDKTRQQKPIPDDAAMVLVPGADGSIGTKLRPLQEYMKRPDGKLFLFLEPKRDRDARVQPSGFEDFLKSYGVLVGADLVVHPPVETSPRPTNAVGMPMLSGFRQLQSMDPRLESAYVAQQANVPLPLGECRSLKVGPAEGFEARPLLVTYWLADPSQNITGQWAEAAPIADMDSYLNGILRSREELQRKMLTPPFPLAVTVSERGKPAEPPQPGMPPPPAAPGKPRLAVFASTNALLPGSLERNPYSLFFITSTLGWLKDKEIAVDNAVQVKQRQFYTVRVPPGEEGTIRWQPLLLMLALVILVGVGVGLLRRR